MNKRAALRRRLLDWYDRHRRRLPWRENPSPYRVWLSEIMLQQTQVVTVVPYFRRFLRKYPSLRALARARESDVLRLWAGLGYYSRARSLRRAARAVAAEHGGRLPDRLEALRALPGIGPYTAAAIASIAFGRPHELVDGNVARVLARLRGVRGDVKTAAVSRRLWAAARELLHPRRPGDWNQALMELGALVCLPPPDVPRCRQCPLQEFCFACQHGAQNRLPGRTARRTTIRLEWTGLDIRRNGKRLLWRRAADERLLGGHWGLPEPRHLRRAKAGVPLRTIRHSITHHRITLRVRAAAISGRLPAAARWVPEQDLKRYLVSSLWRKAIERIKT
ncbi:MAG: A/G-specific adenine glycosylase [Elusimicrobiota bacterium]